MKILNKLILTILILLSVSCSNNEKVSIRNPFSTRPLQHVLDPLNGYLLLAESLFDKLTQESKPINTFSRAFNFGPKSENEIAAFSEFTTTLDSSSEYSKSFTREVEEKFFDIYHGEN